jgi:hypothetical protein
VMSVYAMTFMGMAPLGALLAGTAADVLGAPMAIGIGGGISIAGGLVFLLRLAELRPEARRLIREQVEVRE